MIGSWFDHLGHDCVLLDRDLTCRQATDAMQQDPLGYGCPFWPLFDQNWVFDHDLTVIDLTIWVKSAVDRPVLTASVRRAGIEKAADHGPAFNQYLASI